MTTKRTTLTAEQKPISEEINLYIDRAVTAWTNYNNSGGKLKDNSDYLYEMAEKAAKKMINVKSNLNPDFMLKNVSLDCGVGLYPTFEMEYLYKAETRHYTAYNTDQFFKTINGFWN